jgi:hypothetical protein
MQQHKGIVVGTVAVIRGSRSHGGRQPLGSDRLTEMRP